MTDTTTAPARTVTHSTFVIERTYEASPARVFRAFSDPAIKSRWFQGPPEWGEDEQELDFRVGGCELSRGGPKGGPVHTFEGRYYDIVPNERIVFTYDMLIDQTRICVSLATIEFRADGPPGKHTKLTFTEHGAYLDGWDHPDDREHGTRELLNMLAEFLERNGDA